MEVLMVVLEVLKHHSSRSILNPSHSCPHALHKLWVAPKRVLTQVGHGGVDTKNDSCHMTCSMTARITMTTDSGSSLIARVAGL